MKAKFVGSSKEQVAWGSNDDPSGVLEVGKEYNVVGLEVHTTHTKIILTDYPKLRFNSVAFEYDQKEQNKAVTAWQDWVRQMERKSPFVYYP